MPAFLVSASCVVFALQLLVAFLLPPLHAFSDKVAPSAAVMYKQFVVVHINACRLGYKFSAGRTHTHRWSEGGRMSKRGREGKGESEKEGKGEEKRESEKGGE